MKTTVVNKISGIFSAIIVLGLGVARIQAGPGPQTYLPAKTPPPENMTTIGSVNNAAVVIDMAGKERVVPATITHTGSEYVITEKNGQAAYVSIPQSQAHN